MKPDIFQRLLEKFPSKRVAVIGDFILDEYVIGDTKRVSREAPVVVIDYRESLYHPGGAANAVQNVASLGGAAIACGVLGDDREGTILTEIVTETGAEVELLLKDTRVSTAVKTRILAGELHAQRQQIARIDRSRRVPTDSEALRRLTGDAAAVAERADAVLISDYGLGVTPGALSDKIIGACNASGVPVVVDSRHHLLGFEGATVATPNEVELFDAMKLDKNDRRDIETLATRVLEQQKLAGLIVTRGSKGMQVCDAGGKSLQVGIVGSRDVADVTGAGDTVSATVALSLACGATMLEAAEMATYAAAVVVMKRGTATVSRDELEVTRTKYPHPQLDGVDNA